MGCAGSHVEDEVALDAAPVGELVERDFELGVGRASVLDDERCVEAVRTTESASFPVIVPVMAAAGVPGSVSVSNRQRTTRVDVAARRKSVELIRIPPQGSAANAAE